MVTGKGPAVLTIVTAARHTAEIRPKIRGNRGAIVLLKRAGVPKLYDYTPPSGGGPCWTFPAARIPDVLAAADSPGRARFHVILRPEQEALF